MIGTHAAPGPAIERGCGGIAVTITLEDGEGKNGRSGMKHGHLNFVAILFSRGVV